MRTEFESIAALAEKFILAPGISGYEGEIAKLVFAELQGCTDELHRDRAGNVTGFIRGRDDSAPVVMVVAHMDQIGMIVTRVCDNGLLRITKNGSVPDKILPGSELSVRTLDGGYIPAAVAVKPHHAMSEADKARVEPLTELYVDIGAKDKEEALASGVRAGCAVQYRPNFVRLLGTRVAGTAIDNRMSLAVMVSCAREIFADRPDCSVYFSATVQEEHNLRGGMLAARAAKPDIMLCLDVTLDSSQPGMEDLLDNPIGSGPTMGMYSFHGRGTLNGTIAHEGLARLAQRSADELGIKLNRFAMRGVLSDSSYVQFEGDGGTACLDLGFPARYTHSPMELCDLQDAAQLRELLCRMLKDIRSDFNCGRF